MALIVSSIPGRIRIRHKAFSSPQRGARAKAALLALDGVGHVEVHADAASLIVHYDAGTIPVEAMEIAVDAIADAELNLPRDGQERTATLNRYAKYGMLSSLAVSLLLAANGARRAHALAGGVFIACLGLHLLHHRARVLD
ncbi:MAG: hypothetical protein LBO79_06085 [Zoogloeaceae bacterium]|jgi:hypothetical protein|nr:hypothetical protein [Zoogloeaceae bacterium]